MSQAVTLVAAMAFVALFRVPIKAKPSLFYLLAIVLACIGVCFTYNPVAHEALRSVVYAIQKGHMGFAFLVIVMFMGAFREDSTLRRMLQPIRGELSVVAAILMAAHCVLYIASYAGMVDAVGSLRPSILASLGIAVVVLGLLVALAVTSLQVVKHAMRVSAWKRVQWLSYIFFALIFFHMLGYMVIPVQAGSLHPSIALVFYLVVYASYATARIRRWFLDRQQAQDGQTDIA